MSRLVSFEKELLEFPQKFLVCPDCKTIFTCDAHDAFLEEVCVYCGFPLVFPLKEVIGGNL